MTNVRNTKYCSSLIKIQNDKVMFMKYHEMLHFACIIGVLKVTFFLRKKIEETHKSEKIVISQPDKRDMKLTKVKFPLL